MPRTPDTRTKYERQTTAIRQQLATNKVAREASAKEDALLTGQLRRLDKAEAARKHSQKRAAAAGIVEDAGLLALDSECLRILLRAVARLCKTDPDAVRDLLGLDAILAGEVDVIQLVREEVPHAQP